MNPNALIETYVSDVVRYLPRAQRNDVAFELRSLLQEELEGRAAEVGREPDTSLVMGLLTGFGRPVEVADRYRPAGFTVIRPSEAPRFARVAIGGVLVQWILTLAATFSRPSDLDWLSLLGAWWLPWGLGAFWWPGLLVTLSLIAGFVHSRREAASEWVPARDIVRDRDQVRRGVFVLYLALGVVGASIVCAVPSLPIWGSGLPAPLVTALTLDQVFLATRAPWAVVLWVASLTVGVVILVAGRWTRATRRVSAAFDLAWIALLTWWIAAGPIFTREYANEVTKGCLVLVLIVILVDLVIAVRRATRSIRTPRVA